MNEKKIRVLLADDSPIAIEGMTKLIETTTDILVVGEASTAQEISGKVSHLSPDILIVDLKWFGDTTAGITAIKEVRAISSQIKIIAITAYESLINDARKAGADAAIPKEVKIGDFLSLIRELFKRSNFVADISIDSGNPPKEILSYREKQVLLLIAEGKSDREIAEQLSIAESTAKNHVRKILEKTFAKNRTQAVSIARDLGIL